MIGQLTQRNRRRRRIRRLLLALLLAALVLRVSMIRGWPRPLRIASASMAPALRNRHYSLRCDDCDAPLTVDATTQKTGDLVACWNCGYRHSRIQPWHIRTGDRVWIDSFPYLWRRPRRWEVVAMGTTDGKYLTKRVLALPGEKLALVDGDVWIDGAIVRKSLAEFRRQRVLVHDSRFQPSLAGSPRRWRRDRDGRWRRIGLGWQIEQSAKENSNVAWLEYRHLCEYADGSPPRKRGEEIPVLDLVAYNGSRTRAPLHAVPDLVLDAELHWSSDAVWLLRWRTSETVWSARVDVAAQRLQIERDGKIVLDQAMGWRGSRRKMRRIEWGMWDRQLVLAVDGAVVARHELDSATPIGSVSRSLAVGCRRGRLLVGRRRVYRDIYYFGPDGSTRRWSAPAPLARLFLAGDNQPASIDSRFGRGMGDHARLLGRVVRWYGAQP